MKLDELLEGEVPLDAGNVLRVHELGDIALPTGQLVARDPLAGADAPPFNLSIAPGRYPVSLRVIYTPNAPSTRLYFDVAALVIRLSKARCVRWDIALTDHDPAKEDLRAGGHPGFAVDSATAAFLDDSVQHHLDADGVASMVNDARKPPGGAVFSLGGAAINLAFCTSGAGDGVYAAWVGYDASDRAAAVVIDFRMLDLERPALLTDAQLDRRAAAVAAELTTATDARVLRAAMGEAVALGERARPLVALLENLATRQPSDVRSQPIRDQAARTLGELDKVLGLRDAYAAMLKTGDPSVPLDLALTVASRLDWEPAQMLELGAAAAAIALTSSSSTTIISAIRCMDLFGINDVTVWTNLASHADPAVRIALLDAAARNYRAERAADYNEDEREYRAQRVGVAVLDANIAKGIVDADPDVRAAAANALGVAVAEDPARRTALLSAIDDSDPRVVLAATQHLTFRKDLEPELVARMRTALERIATGGDRAYARKASSALGRLPA